MTKRSRSIVLETTEQREADACKEGDDLRRKERRILRKRHEAQRVRPERGASIERHHCAIREADYVLGLENDPELEGWLQHGAVEP